MRCWRWCWWETDNQRIISKWRCASHRNGKRYPQARKIRACYTLGSDALSRWTESCNKRPVISAQSPSSCLGLFNKRTRCIIADNCRLFLSSQLMTSSPDSTPFRPGFPGCSAIHSSSKLVLIEGELEISMSLGHFSLVLPFNVSSYLRLIETYRGYEIPHTPNALFLKVSFFDKLKPFSKVEAWSSFEFLDDGGDG